jgi:GxxExxY protein
VQYKGVRLDGGFRIDLIVEGTVIVEIKAVEELAPVHEARLLTHLRLSGMRVGLLFNFNTSRLMDDFKRRVL